MLGTRVKSFWPVFVGETAAAVALDVVANVADGRIRAGDFAVAFAKNVSAAALQGSAAGVFCAVTGNGNVRVTFPAAAGGEIFTVAVFPKGLPKQ